MSFSSCSNSSSIVCIAIVSPVWSVMGPPEGRRYKSTSCPAGAGQPCKLHARSTRAALHARASAFELRDVQRSQCEQPAQRDVHPVGPIVQLVGELVERLVHDEGAQQRIEIVFAVR